MKKLFKYEINESIAAKAAMNCVHKRLFKEFYPGHPTPQKEVVYGDYDPYEWQMDAYGNGSKRELVHQALVDLKCTETVEEGWQYNNIIQELIDKHNPKITNLDDAKEFVRDYASDLGVVIPEPEISEQEEDGINKGGMHNLVQVGHIMNTPSMHDELEPEFSDLKEQEGYNMNFREIAELVADQIDRENPEAKGVQNNMDAIFEIVKEVWRNNDDDLWIYDYDEVDEEACMDFFDNHYEEIKKAYFEKDKNNIMDATHGNLLA